MQHIQSVWKWSNIKYYSLIVKGDDMKVPKEVEKKMFMMEQNFIICCKGK